MLPAGTTHKTYNTKLADSLTLLTLGDGYGIAGSDVYDALDEIEMRLLGFTMIGVYPLKIGIGTLEGDARILLPTKRSGAYLS